MTIIISILVSLIPILGKDSVSKQSVLINHSENVPLFSSETSNSVIAVIDTSSVDVFECFYYVSRGKERTHVICEKSREDSSEKVIDSISGWVNNKYCGGYLQNFCIQGGEHFVTLYERPELNGNKKRIIVEQSIFANIIQYNTPWYQVQFYYDGIYYSGWAYNLTFSVY